MDYVGRCAHKGSSIAFDCILSVSEDAVAGYYGAGEFLRSMREHHANEEMVFSLPRGGIEAFLAESRLRMTECMDSERIERKFLLSGDGLPIGRMTGIFCFVCASPEG